MAGIAWALWSIAPACGGSEGIGCAEWSTAGWLAGAGGVGAGGV
jgi:hypothetical protein